MILTATQCLDCGGRIPEARLRVVPGAVRCLDCQVQSELSPPRPIVETCPCCGSRLLWRAHREGAGAYFLGCSAFPACRYLEHVSA